MFAPTRILFACLLALSFAGSVSAEIFTYRDVNGRLVFVDDKDKIPVEFQQNSSSLAAPGDSLGAFSSPLKDKDKETFNGAGSEDNIDSFEPADQPETNIIITGNRVLVPVEVGMGGRTVKVTLLLDTGATRTVFHRNALDRLDLPDGKTYQARIAGGGTLLSQKIRFRHITVGPYRIEKAYAMVINLEGRQVPYDGMLGMDFLKDHPYKIDFEEQVIRWED